MSNWILDTTELSLAYGDRQLLQTDRLTVFEGDRIGLIGENGAGKTTLLRILAGEIQPDSGSVRRLVPAAFIHQQGSAARGEDDRISALFRAREDHPGLSGGEMTRNRIAGALAAHARLLMADEPTTDLDLEGLRLLRKQLSGFQGSLILISHDRALLRSLCTRIWYLEDGGAGLPGQESAVPYGKQRSPPAQAGMDGFRAADQPCEKNAAEQNGASGRKGKTPGPA